LGNNQLPVYANVPSNNDRAVNDAVLYSDLQSMDDHDHTSTSNRSNAVESSEPNVVYGNIVESQEPVLEKANDNNRELNGAVLYSELQSKDHIPTGDLYAQVQKRNTPYPN